MSIIEKAVGKLGAKPDQKEAKETGPGEEVAEVKEALQRVERLESGEGLDEGASPHDSVLAGEDRRVLLPYAQLKQAGMITPDAPRSAIAEEFRRIKRPLLMNIDSSELAAPIKNPNLIMVTSALPGEGKTFTAINLAISIALEQDKTVLFVDADVAKASAEKLLGVPRKAKGLIDVLENPQLDLREVLFHTDIPNLRILPAGRVHDRSTELLASENMRRLMAELADRYQDRVIVFDSPPLLPTTEAGVLANLMGQIVFVVAANKTSQGAVTEAIEHIEGDKVIGMVLNKSTARFGLSYGYAYGYEYAYGYGYGYGEGAREPGSS